MFEQTHTRIEGVIIGFDEYMNLVLDDASEIKYSNGVASNTIQIGRILLKGDNITLMQNAPDSNDNKTE